MYRRLISAGLLAVFTFLPNHAWAIRPFVTDDARVVGARLVQLETWVQIDSRSFAHWVLPAFGPTRWLELSAGGLHGAVGTPRAYSAALPLLQGKALLLETHDGGLPGLAMVLGALTAHGTGLFRPATTNGFGYLASTASFRGEAFLVHANLGLGYGDRSFIVTAGLGSQVAVIGGLKAVAEIVRGDAYSRATDGALQGGMRFIFNDSVQIDATMGSGVWGHEQRPLWATMGLRLVTGQLW